MYAPFPVS